MGRVSADAVRAISKAAELFMGQLAAKALEHAQASKKKNFKAADVAAVAARDRCAGGGALVCWGGRLLRAVCRGAQGLPAPRSQGVGACSHMVVPPRLPAHPPLTSQFACFPPHFPFPQRPTQPHLRRLQDMGLREVLDEAAAAAGGGTEEENAAAAAATAADKRLAAKRQKQEEAAAGMLQITSFFGAAPAAAAAEDMEAAA